jgi:hypothetical protein
MNTPASIAALAASLNSNAGRASAALAKTGKYAALVAGKTSVQMALPALPKDASKAQKAEREIQVAAFNAVRALRLASPELCDALGLTAF